MNGNTQSHQATVSVGFAQWGTVLGTLLFIFCDWFAKCPRICFIVTFMLIILFYVNRSPWNTYFKNWIWYELNSDLTGWVKMKRSQQAVMRGLIGETPLLFHSLSILSFFEGMALWDNSNAARLNLNHSALPKVTLFSEDSIGSLYIAEGLRTALTLLASVYNLFKALVSLFDISFNSHNCNI